MYFRVPSVSVLLAVLSICATQAELIPISGIEAFHQGDSLDGDGSVLDVINGTGMNKVDPEDPSTWTISSVAWQDDWQGFQAPGIPDNTWAVIDLGAPVVELETMYLWNVQEPNAIDRGVDEFEIFHASEPVVRPPRTSGAVTPYDFSSGGWTSIGATNLARGAGIGETGQAFDVSEAAGARFIGLRLLSAHGSTSRVGFGEVAFTDTVDENAVVPGEPLPPPPPPPPPSGPVLIPVGIETFHQGDSSSPGNGSNSRVIDGSGMNKVDPDDPATWTVSSSAWADDWQGFAAPTANGNWAVLDLGAPMVLDRMYLWNVQEASALDRGMNTFNLWHTNQPTVAVPATGANVTNYEFSSGGWTLLNPDEPLALAMGSGVGDQSQSFDVSGASGSQYIGIEILSNHGSTQRVGFGEVAFTIGEADLPLPLDVAYDPLTDSLTLSWASEGGLHYRIRSETDSSASVPIDWPVFGGFADIDATPPVNTVTFPKPVDGLRLFVVESYPAPPEVVFSDDFESGATGWTVGNDGVGDNTAWELGSPSGPGPATANSLVNCFGTNLDDTYGEFADVWLRSPVIDFSATGAATLSYFRYIDIEEEFDGGQVAALAAADDSVIAILEAQIEGGPAGWDEISYSLPAEALGKEIKIEFRLTTDEVEQFSGFYIDDVTLTVP